MLLKMAMSDTLLLLLRQPVTIPTTTDSVSMDPAWWWTVAGPVAITLLFVCYSIPAMEKRLRESRHDYLEYARKTPLILPWRLFN